MDLALAGDEAGTAALMRETGVHIRDGGRYFDLVARQPVVVATLSPVPQPAVTPALTQIASRTWGRRYAVGNPGTFLGSRFETGLAPTATVTRRASGIR